MAKNIKEQRNAAEAEFKQRQAAMSKNMTEWSQEDIDAHLSALEDIYAGSAGKFNALGDFSHDPEHVYYWHVVDDRHESKLDARLRVGYAFATKDDLERSGIQRRVKDGEMYGESCITANAGAGMKSILLKIPRQIHEYNQEMKRKLREKQSLKDYRGRPVGTKVSQTGTSRVVQESHEDISMDNL